MLRAILILGRVSNLPTVWTNVLLGWFVGGGAWVAELGWLTLGVSLLYVAGMTLNDAFDAQWDSEHAQERPIPSGDLSRGAVWAIGLLEMAGGLALLLTQTTFHPALLGGLVGAIFLYNWLHKKWAGSVLIMGLCRGLVYLGAASAVVSHTTSIEIPKVVWVVAVGMIIYIAGLTLAARSERTSEGEMVLPFWKRLMLLLPILFPIYAARNGFGDTTSYIAAGAAFIVIWAWISLSQSALASHIPKGIAWFIAGIALIDGGVLLFSDWRAAAACVGAFLLTLAAQRVIPAT